MAVKLDIIEGNRGRFGPEGWEFERIATVTGVEGEGAEKLINAVNAEGMPQYLSPHPEIPYCLLREIIPEAIDSETIQVRLLYSVPTIPSREPQLDIVEVGAGLSQVEANKDIFGSIMSVKYVPGENYPYKNESPDWVGNENLIQGGIVSRFIPENTIVISKKEYAAPLAKSKTYVGKVNATGWTLDPTAPERTWLCTGIIGRSQDSGYSYIVTYSFQYKPDKWDATIVWIDPHDGKPPADLVEDIGIKTYQDYDVKNFNELGL